MQHINAFSGGMKGGIDYTLFPQDSYTMMLNGTLVSKDEHGLTITNAKGTTYRGEFRENEYPIGSCFFDNVLYIVAHLTEGDEKYITLYSKAFGGQAGYTEEDMSVVYNMKDGDNYVGFKASASLFGYDTSKLLEVVAKESYDGTVDLYLCDGLNPNAIINTGVDKEGIQVKERYYPYNITENVFSQQSNISAVPRASYEIEGHGNMKPGTYYLYLRYEDRSLNTTPFIKEIGPIFIHAGESTGTPPNVSGAINDGDVRVSKRIVLKISNTDPNYKYISVGVVYYYGQDGILSRDNYLIDKSISLTGNNNTLIIDGNNAIRALTLEELFDDNISQDRSKAQVQLDGRWFGANWKGNDLDYAHLKETARRIIPHSILNIKNNFDAQVDETDSETEYMENEIYPFGVSFLIDGRYKTPVFPICGWNTTDDDIIVLHVPSPSIRVLNYTGLTAHNVGLNGDCTNDTSIVDGNNKVGAVGYLIRTSNVVDMNDFTKKYELARGHGVMSFPITGLKANTTYYAWVFAKDIEGYYYFSDPLAFKTQSGIVEFGNGTVQNIEYFKALAYSDIIKDNGSPITKRGFCWSKINTAGHPNVNDNKIEESFTTYGNYNVMVEGLEDGTDYYLRPYTINGVGVQYGPIKSFKTLAPSVTIEAPASENTIHGFKLKGITHIQFGITVIEKGFIIGTTPDVTYDEDMVFKNTQSNGYYNSQIEGLVPSTEYNYKAYMICNTPLGSKTYVSDIAIASTRALSISLIEVMDARWVDVVLKAEITTSLYDGIVERGLLVGTTDMVNTSSYTSKKIVDLQTLIYQAAVDELEPATSYYGRAYLIIKGGQIMLSNVLSFETLGGHIDLTVLYAIERTNRKLVLGGTMSNPDNVNIIYQGICIRAQSELPLIVPPIVSNWSEYAIEGTPVFQVIFEGPDDEFSLEPRILENTVYAYRAFVITAAGVQYSDYKLVRSYSDADMIDVAVMATISSNKKSITFDTSKMFYPDVVNVNTRLRIDFNITNQIGVVASTAYIEEGESSVIKNFGSVVILDVEIISITPQSFNNLTYYIHS